MFSKLSLNYPIGDPAKWLDFLHSWQWEIDPVFAGRLAALAQSQGKKMHSSSGYRSYDEQVRSYKSTGGHQDAKGNWVGGNGMARRPGTSWHEFGCATDTSDPWLKLLDKTAATAGQKTLLKFGLFKPLTPGNKVMSGGKVVCEDWHIQPIETNGILIPGMKAFHCYQTRPDLHYGAQGDDVKLLQLFLTAKGSACGIIDGIFGGKTQTAVMAFQKANGLPPEGAVNPLTWRKLLYNK